MATALRTINPNPKTQWCGLSGEPKLEALVTTAAAFSHVCSPDERAHLAQWIPGYEAALDPASEQGRRRAIGKIALAYPGAKLNDDEAAARLELYVAALSDIPPDVLADACMRAVRECKFFPAVSEIRERCVGLAKRQWELSKIRALIATHDRRWQPAGEPMNDSDRAEFAKLAQRIA